MRALGESCKRALDESRKYFLGRGSYTVEAAFIVPLIMGIVFAWMFVMFYLHDRVIMKGMLQDVVMAQKERPFTTGESWKTPEVDAEELRSLLWVTDIESIRMKKGVLQDRYVVTGTASWNIPSMHWFVKELRCEITVETGRTEPETWLRMKEVPKGD